MTSPRKTQPCARTRAAALTLASWGGIFLLAAAASAAWAPVRTWWTHGYYEPENALARHHFAALDARTNKPSAELFSPAAPTPSTVSNATRNADCWLGDLRGVSAFSACRDEADYYDSPVTLLTRRHVYWRGHDSGWTNTSGMQTNVATNAVWFLGTNSVVHRATMIRKAGYLDGTRDFSIGLLSADVPGDVESMTFVTNAAAKWDSVNNPFGFVMFCQHRYLGNDTGRVPTPGAAHDYFVPGDSGSPTCYAVNGALLMTGGATTSGWSPELTNTVHFLSTNNGLTAASYPLSVTNVDTFPNYPYTQ